MTNIIDDIVTKDPDLFYCEHKNDLEKHIVKSAPFLSFSESLYTYTGEPFPESDTDRLQYLWKRSRAATCAAVTDIWIKENPTQYLNFIASGKRLGDYIHSIGVKVK